MGRVIGLTPAPPRRQPTTVVIDTSTVVETLERRGILPANSGASAIELPGGVSGTVLAVHSRERDLVVKQALARLKVAEEWLSEPERLVTEHRALQLASTIVPEHVPPVVDLDEQQLVLTMERAPVGWTDWRSELFALRIDATVADQLGRMLARLHAGTIDRALTRAFDDRTVFEQLRVDPFHRTVAERVSEVRAEVVGVTERMLSIQRCLVHGDFTPKNVLVGGTGLWVLDWEVAHVGDPTFDLASLLCHLVLKGVHRPPGRVRCHECAQQFVAAYDRVVPIESLEGGEAHLTAQVACMLLARVAGKSPASYLDAAERATVRELAVRALRERWSDQAGFWRSR